MIEINLSDILSASNVLSFVIGALSSGIVSYYFYKKSKEDASKQQWGTRLDWLEAGHKVFLVAVLNEQPIPLYSLLNWSGTVIFEERVIPIRIGSNGPIMSNSLNSRTPHLLESVQNAGVLPKDVVFQLTDYGKACAEYLSKNEVDDAKFDNIDSTHSSNLYTHYGSFHGPQKHTWVVTPTL